MDSLERMAAKLGLSRELERMVLSGVSELQLLDFFTLAYVEFLKDHRVALLSAFFQSRSGDAAKDRGFMPIQAANIITDANFFHDS